MTCKRINPTIDPCLRDFLSMLPPGTLSAVVDTTDSILAEITDKTLKNMRAECRRLMRLYIIEGLEKKEIMAIVKLPKSSFHRKWKECYDTLLQKIQNFCEYHGKK